MIDSNVLRQWYRFGEIDHPNADSLLIVYDQQTRSDQLVTRKKRRIDQIRSQLFEPIDQLGNELRIGRQKLSEDVLNLIGLTNVLQVFADVVAVTL